MRTSFILGLGVLVPLSLSVSAAIYVAEMILPSGGPVSVHEFEQMDSQEEIVAAYSSPEPSSEDRSTFAGLATPPAVPSAAVSGTAATIADKSPELDEVGNPEVPEANGLVDAIELAGVAILDETSDRDATLDGSAPNVAVPVIESKAPTAPLSPDVDAPDIVTPSRHGLAASGAEETRPAVPLVAMALQGLLPSDPAIGPAGNSDAVIEVLKTADQPLPLPPPAAVSRVADLTGISILTPDAPDRPAGEMGVKSSVSPILALALARAIRAGDTPPRSSTPPEDQRPVARADTILPEGQFALEIKNEPPVGGRILGQFDSGLDDLLIRRQIPQSPQDRPTLAGPVQLAVLSVDNSLARVEQLPPTPRPLLSASETEAASEVELAPETDPTSETGSAAEVEPASDIEPTSEAEIRDAGQSDLDGQGTEVVSQRPAETTEPAPAATLGVSDTTSGPIGTIENAAILDKPMTEPDATPENLSGLLTSIRPPSRPKRLAVVIAQPEPPAPPAPIARVEPRQQEPTVALKKPTTAVARGASVVIVGVFDLGSESWALVRNARGDISELRVGDRIAGVQVRGIKGKMLEVDTRGRVVTLGAGDLLGVGR